MGIWGRARPLAAITAATVLLGAACGGGGGDRGGDSSDTKPTTTSTTLAADPASTQLSQDALITQADLGPGWVEYRAASDPEPMERQCGEVQLTVKNVPGGTRRNGAVHQLGDQSAFVQSTVIVFKDAASAEEYVERRLSDAYLECFRARLEDEQRDRDENLQVSISEYDAPAPGGGYEGTTRFSVTSDGTEAAALYRSVYRYGRAVILVGIDVGQSDNPNLGTTVTDAAQRAILQVQSRVAE